MATTTLPSLPGYKAKVPMRAIRTKAKPDDPLIDIVSNTRKLHHSKTGSQTIDPEDDTILSFQAYFIELHNETEKPRHCQINYFVSTSELNIILKPQINSGILPGTRLRRAVYMNSEGMPFGPSDFDFDKALTIEGVQYFIVDCDYETREFLRRRLMGFELSTSSIASLSSTKVPDSKLSVMDDWGKFHSKRNANKTFQEAQLGRAPPDLLREGFLRFGTNVLKFVLRKHDETKDDVVKDFSLVYHLADDTIEIFALGDYNGNRGGFSKLLSRGKLPKTICSLSINRDAREEPQYYHWSEFHMGMVVNAYNRQLRIVDADSYTRSLYEEVESSLGPAESTSVPESRSLEREIPPYSGFGSEEDSLRSCVGTLQTRAPIVKALGQNHIYNFKAKIVECKSPDDVEREFIFSYYFLDNTLRVTEPPLRNSGFMGGVFLSRRKLRLPNGEHLLPNDLYVGKKIELSQRVFQLVETDERTLRTMEETGHPLANVDHILNKLRAKLVTCAEQFNMQFEFSPGILQGGAYFEFLSNVLSSFGLIGEDESQLSQHQVITLARAFAREKARPETFQHEALMVALFSGKEEATL